MLVSHPYKSAHTNKLSYIILGINNNKLQYYYIKYVIPGQVNY
jgi:hypothetical protein